MGESVENLPNILSRLFHKGPGGFLNPSKDNRQSNDNKPSEDLQLLSHFMLLPLAGDDDANGRNDEAGGLYKVHKGIKVLNIINLAQVGQQSINGREGIGVVHGSFPCGTLKSYSLTDPRSRFRYKDLQLYFPPHKTQTN